MVTPVFGMGLTEILLVGVVILLLFSPKELPGMLKTVARVYGSLRRTAEDFRAQVMEAEELREPFDEIRDAYQGTRAEIAKAQGAARRELAKARLEARMAEQRLSRLAREQTELKQEAPKGDALPPASPAASDMSSEPTSVQPVDAAQAPKQAAEQAADEPPPSFAPPGVRTSAAPNKRAPTSDDPDKRGAA
jgi:Tat protein translocase TatB subunit